MLAEREEEILAFNVKSVWRQMEGIARRWVYQDLKDIITIVDEEDFFIADEVVDQILALDKDRGPLDIVVGKFLAAWVFAGIALGLTFPIWITVNYLGNPDNGIIVASYLGSWMMAGGFLAIGSCMSAITKSQVIAFVLCGFVSLLFVMAGFPLVLDLVRGWLPLTLIDMVASLSFLTHFNAVSRGVFSLQDFLYFISVIVVWLGATSIVLDMKKGA